VCLGKEKLKDGKIISFHTIDSGGSDRKKHEYKEGDSDFGIFEYAGLCLVGHVRR
jgi:hypothetical protein